MATIALSCQADVAKLDQLLDSHAASALSKQEPCAKLQQQLVDSLARVKSALRGSVSCTEQAAPASSKGDALPALPDPSQPSSAALQDEVQAAASQVAEQRSAYPAIIENLFSQRLDRASESLHVAESAPSVPSDAADLTTSSPISPGLPVLVQRSADATQQVEALRSRMQLGLGRLSSIVAAIQQDQEIARQVPADADDTCSLVDAAGVNRSIIAASMQLASHKA